jgi:glucose-6-phosphate isomerase
MPGAVSDRSGQIEHPGQFAGAVAAAMERLSAERFVERCWRRDVTLWADPAERENVAQRLGWLGITDVMRGRVNELRAFADDIKAAGFTRALLLGMGGSSLFPEVCRLTFGVAPGAVDVGVLDSTDPAAVRAFERRGPLTSTLAVISSKSGTTAEVSALTKYFHERFKSAGGAPGDHCMAVTDSGTPLEALAKELRFRRMFVLGPDTGKDIGGRFSALSYFGLVPAALLGIDVARLLERGRLMLDRCAPDVAIDENPAARLGAILAALGRAGRDKVTFLFPEPLASFGTWLEQLIAESTGKNGTGITPVVGEPLLEPLRYSNDRLFIELQMRGRTDADVEKTSLALIERGEPVVRIQLQDPYDLGGEAMRWSLATTAAGWLLGVNPFSEPNVWESKNLTKTLLDQYARDRKLPERTPVAADDAFEVYGASKTAGASAADAITALVKLRRPHDFLAVLSFLPRLDVVDAELAMLRALIAHKTGSASLLETGPRYLHSTGQLYKGGPDNGVFLLLTADDPEDLAIPGEPFTFGALKAAQALGDFEATQQKGRRILRVHLRGPLDAALRRLQAVIGSALG